MAMHQLRTGWLKLARPDSKSMAVRVPVFLFLARAGEHEDQRLLSINCRTTRKVSSESSMMPVVSSPM